MTLGNLVVSAQIVTIPDTIFKAELVGNALINTNADTEIQVSEAQAFTGFMSVFNKGIGDLTGIEAFTALTGINCGLNLFTTVDFSGNTALKILNCIGILCPTIDISSNTALTRLDCSSNVLTAVDVSTNIALENLTVSTNNLTTLDVSTNIALESLNVNGNNLTTLDVSSNTALEQLYCSNGQLTFLDVSNNLALRFLSCGYNPITSLDLSMNTALIRVLCGSSSVLTTLNLQNGNNINMPATNFDATACPNLNCIQVDDTTYSNTNWINKIDLGTVFSQSAVACSVLSQISTLGGAMPNLNVYPNPTAREININLGAIYNDINVAVHNTVGQLVFSNTYTGIENLKLELEGSVGMYFVKIKTEAGESTIKVVKEL